MKLTVAALLYLIAFVAHLVPVYALSQQSSYVRWVSTLQAFGTSPLPGTDALIITLRVWWAYPLIAAVVFVYWLLLRKKLATSLIFMVALALLFWAYYYGPVIAMGRVV